MHTEQVEETGNIILVILYSLSGHREELISSRCPALWENVQCAEPPKALVLSDRTESKAVPGPAVID